MIIIGTGAQAKYAADICNILGIHIDKIYEPYDRSWKGKKFLNQFKVEKLNIEKLPKYSVLSLCFSNPYEKERYVKTLQFLIPSYITLVHPSAKIGTNCNIGSGTIINANAVIQPDTKISEFCMIHAGVNVDHNCKISSFVNLAPGVTLAGGISIGKYTVINTGTIIAPNLTIGSKCIIGAGSLVLKSIPDGKLGFGHPVDMNNLKETENHDSI